MLLILYFYTRGHSADAKRLLLQIGKWLPILSRAVVKTVLEVDHTEGDWNVVQNNGMFMSMASIANYLPSKLSSYIPISLPMPCLRPYQGPRAAQIIPHVHFHIVPRPPHGALPTLKQTSYTMFARGRRSELDEEDSLVLASQIREQIAKEVQDVKLKEGIDLYEASNGREGRTLGGEGRGRL